MKLAERLELKYIKEFKKLAVSDTFDLLGKPLTLPELEAIIKEKKIPEIVAAKIAQDKFNQLIAPYLKMKPVNLLTGKDSMGDEGLDMFLHDLIHEAIREGSIAEFKIKDKDKTRSSFDKYQLVDHVDEAKAERFSTGDGASAFSDALDQLQSRLNLTRIKTQADLAKAIEENFFTPQHSLFGPQRQIVRTILKHLVNFTRHDPGIKSLMDKAIASRGGTLANSDWYNLFKNLKNKAKQLFLNIVEVPNKSIMEDERVASLLRRWISALKVAYMNWQTPDKQMTVAQLASKFIEKFGSHDKYDSQLASWLENVLENGKTAQSPRGTKVYPSGKPEDKQYGVLSPKGWKAYFFTAKMAAIEAAKCDENSNYIPQSEKL